jgi:RNA polymerase sigma-70 factor (ECF subfamily)
VEIRDFLANSYPRLVAAIALIAGSHAAAEDAVQEALARAWERSDRGEEFDTLPAWVTRVAINLTKSRLRRNKVEAGARSRLAPDLGAPATWPDARDDSIELDRAIEALPRRQKESVVLHYYLGLDVKGVAEALGVSQGTVKTSLHRARQAIAAAIVPPGPWQDPEEAGRA